jgi:hypothetical protein
MERKIVQIAVDRSDNLIVLCNDGTLWITNCAGWVWEKVEHLPPGCGNHVESEEGQ